MYLPHPILNHIDQEKKTGKNILPDFLVGRTVFPLWLDIDYNHLNFHPSLFLDKLLTRIKLKQFSKCSHSLLKLFHGTRMLRNSDFCPIVFLWNNLICFTAENDLSALVYVTRTVGTSLQNYTTQEELLESSFTLFSLVTYFDNCHGYI